MFGIPEMPLDICVAYSQGFIGYIIEQQLKNVLEIHDMERDIITIATQVLVNKDDPAFQKPTKPIGPFYTKDEADKLAKLTKSVFMEDPRDRGWRKVVASPTPLVIINKKSIEALAKAGAFEGLAERNAIIQNLDHLTSYAHEVQGKNASGQGNLFSLFEEQHQTSIPRLTLPPADPLPEREALAWEKEVLGMFVSEHPFVAILPFLSDQKMTLSSISNKDEGKSRKIAGMISMTKRITTKKGDNMMFAKIEDLSDSLELIIFPRTMQKYSEIIQNDLPCYFEGKISYRNGRGDVTDEPKMLLDKMEIIDVKKIKEKLLKNPIKALEKPKTAELHTIYVSYDMPRDRLEELKRLLVQNKGELPCVVAFMDGERAVKKVKLPFGINLTSTLQVGIETLSRGVRSSSSS